MSAMSADPRDYMHIVADLVRFDHHWCEYCDGPYTAGIQIEDAVEDALDMVAAANGIEFDPYVDALQELANALGSCPNCSTSLGSGFHIGTRWPERPKGHGHKLRMLARSGWDYLTHFTKGKDRSTPFDVLRSILREEVLRGSSHMIKGNHDVVCFTEASPPEIDELISATGDAGAAVKWTRSRHGIAVRRKRLIKGAGARPVIHADESLYDVLPANHKHLFVRFEHDKKFADWTFEREFRVAGDVNLGQFGPADLIVIVETDYERSILLAQENVPPWPIIRFDELGARLDHFVALTERQYDLASARGMDIHSA